MSKVYVIATAHNAYRGREFEPGSLVIDPWRIIPDLPGVTVRRLGENKPALISILLPSRGRPEMFERATFGALKTATFPRRVEVVARLDDDDPRLDRYQMGPPIIGITFLVGPRALLSECWNECYAAANGEILMHCGDDLTFDTPGWDMQVRQAFAESEDKILFVHGDDLGPHGKEFGTHGFLHRRWVETVGYFVPPLFSSDWNDVWLNEVANDIGRRRLLDFQTEHHHYTFGKMERDQTHHDREERGLADDVVGLFKRTVGERKRDAEKLRKVMV